MCNPINTKAKWEALSEEGKHFWLAENIGKQVVAEYLSARNNSPAFRSYHEGIGVLLEEFEELKAEVFLKNVNPEAIRSEAIQVAAMALSMCVDFPPDYTCPNHRPAASMQAKVDVAEVEGRDAVAEVVRCETLAQMELKTKLDDVMADKVRETERLIQANEKLESAEARIAELEADDYQLGIEEGRRHAWDNMVLPFDPLTVVADWDDGDDIAIHVAKATMAHARKELDDAQVLADEGITDDHT